MNIRWLVLGVCVCGFVTPSFAITGADATGIIDVDETITASGSDWQYTFTFTNVSASAPIWQFGAYSLSSSVSGLSGSFGSTDAESLAVSGFADPGYATNNSVAFVEDFSETFPPDVGVGQSGSITFIANTDNTAATKFWAEVEGQSPTTGSDGSNVMSYVGTVTPDSTPEPGLIAAIGFAGLGTAVLRRRR